MSGILMMSVGNSYGSLPINTVAPVVSGTATVGQTLSTTDGTWTAAPPISGFTYQWQRGVANIVGATSSTYVLAVADAGNTVRCVVTATNAVGAVSANSNSTATVAEVTGQEVYTTPGTYTWVAPAGVTSVSVVAIGGGGGGDRAGGCNTTGQGGNGAGLGWKNNYTVTPGSSYTVVVGAGGAGQVLCESTLGGNSFFVSACVVRGGGGNIVVGCGPDRNGIFVGCGGGNGGKNNIGAGGAGGYTGAGGNGGAFVSPNCGNGFSGAGGGGGGGGGKRVGAGLPGFGGGVGIFGQGADGAGGVAATSTAPAGNAGNGGPGSGGPGVPYGGGGRAYRIVSGVVTVAEPGGAGALRIVWPGTSRLFPSTNVGNF